MYMLLTDPYRDVEDAASKMNYSDLKCSTVHQLPAYLATRSAFMDHSYFCKWIKTGDAVPDYNSFSNEVASK